MFKKLTRVNFKIEFDSMQAHGEKKKTLGKHCKVIFLNGANSFGTEIKMVKMQQVIN